MCNVHIHVHVCEWRVKTIHAVINYHVPCMSNCELVEPQHIQNTEEKSTGPV